MTLKNLLVNRDFQGIVIVSLGSYIASFFSYLLQFFLGRTLSIEDYGTFATLLALTYILTIPAGVYSTGITKYVADMTGKENHEKLSYMYKMLVLVGSLFGLFLFVVLFFASRGLSDYFKINNTPLIVLYALSIAVSYIPIVPYSFLQGLLRYRSLAFTSVVSSLLRFALPTICILMGMQLSGVFVGLIATSLLAYIVSYLILKRNLKNVIKTDSIDEYRKIFLISFPILIMNFGLMMLNNIDVIVVKRLFTALEAGYYSGTVTLGKILLFGTSTITVVMFPRVSNAHAKNKDVKKYFVFFFLLQLFVVTAGTVVFNLFPSVLTHLFFGARFADSITLLPIFSIFICIYVLINFLVFFLLAVDKTKVYLLLIPVVILQYILLTRFADNLLSIIHINIFLTASLLIVLFLYSVKSLLEIKK